jgi:hypothetical protein
MRGLPFWFPRKKNVFWYIIFIFLFLASLDFWAWNKNNPMLLGLPFWMYYLLLLTIFSSFIFYLFTRYYWSENK